LAQGKSSSVTAEHLNWKFLSHFLTSWKLFFDDIKQEFYLFGNDVPIALQYLSLSCLHVQPVLSLLFLIVLFDMAISLGEQW
jgi:hypothetical protein